MEEEKRYRVYSNYLKKRYGQKVYRIPVNLPVTCPNRDPHTGKGGCIYCGEVAAGFESLSNTLSVREQIKKNIAYIGPKYKAERFIVYFQNFTNTFLPLSDFERFMKQAVLENVVEFSVSTRPDSLNTKYLDILQQISSENDIQITIEMGLQSVNHKTLAIMDRGHSLAEFIDATGLIKKYGFQVVTHMILDVPYDDVDDVIEGAKILSALKVDGVKLHSLYILKNTPLADKFLNGEVHMGTVKDYVCRTVDFLEYLSPDIQIQRLVGRAPEEETLFCNYGLSWWKIKDLILREMQERGSVQGLKYDYLGGKAVQIFS